MRLNVSLRIGVMFALSICLVMVLKSCTGGYLFSKNMSALVPSVMPSHLNILNENFVPASRSLKSTKWNYLYSFAYLTQQEWYAEYLADNVLRACESNETDVYLTGRKIWKETHFQSMKISYLENIKTDTNGNPVTNENGAYVMETNACAFGLMQVNLNIHKKRILDYNDGILKHKLNCQEDYIRELLKVPINVDLGTGIFKMYLDMFGREDYALCAYFAGENSSYLRKFKNGIGNEYVNWIMDEKRALDEMTMYSFVNPETKVTNKWRYIPKRDERFFETNRVK